MPSRKKTPTKKPPTKKPATKKSSTKSGKKLSAKPVKKSSAKSGKTKKATPKRRATKKGRRMMSSLALSSYVDVQQYLIKILTGNISTSTGQNEESDAVNNAPHGAFWATLSYSDFVNGNVPGGMVDPNTGDPLKILVSGNAADSIIIQALLGTPGSLFDPANPNGFGQMPADGPPFLTAAQVQPISDWINAGCPQ